MRLSLRYTPLKHNPVGRSHLLKWLAGDYLCMSATDNRELIRSGGTYLIMVLLWPLFMPREIVGPLGGTDWRQLSAVLLGAASWATVVLVAMGHI